MTSPETSSGNSNIVISLEKTIYTLSQMESVDRPQVAFAGRSNVGKSSLINCLGNRKNLAKTSSIPGKTRSLNYYLVRPGDFYLVDLPGYGYAKRPKAEREAWGKLMNRYFARKNSLAGVILILDARLDPQVLDMELASLTQRLKLPMIPVLTKIDKCSQRRCNASRDKWQDILGTEVEFLFFSSKTRQGRDQLWERIHLLIQTHTTEDDRPSRQ